MKKMPNLFRFGMTLTMPARYDRVIYYGRGAHENYADRLSSADLGLYEQRVADQYHDEYVRPQESGTKGGLRIPSTECWNGSFNKPMTLYRDVAGAPVETTIPLIEDKSDLWDKKIRSFLDAIITGGKAPVPTSQILYNQAIIDGIFKSNEIGHEVEINIPEI